MRYLTFALGKGRLAKKTLELFEKIGITCEEMKDKEIRVSVKAGEGGRVFGSVSTKEIAEEIKKQLGYEIDKKKILLDAPVKAPGYTEIGIKLHTKVTAKMRVHVVEG